MSMKVAAEPHDIVPITVPLKTPCCCCCCSCRSVSSYCHWCMSEGSTTGVEGAR